MIDELPKPHWEAYFSILALSWGVWDTNAEHKFNNWRPTLTQESAEMFAEAMNRDNYDGWIYNYPRWPATL